MNTYEIEKILKNNKYTKTKYHGIFPIDKLPVSPGVGYYVINLDTSDGPGTHWVAVDIYHKGPKTCKAIYFDSYGRNIRGQFLKRFFKQIKVSYNKRVLQHPFSTVCGQWCVYFLWRRGQQWSLREMLKPFKNKTFLLNDHILNIVMKKNFKIKNKVINKPFLKEIVNRYK